MNDRLTQLLTGALPPAVYRAATRPSAAALTRLAEAHGWRVYRLAGREIADKGAFLDASARALRFPGYFGRNWDAFEECLNDLSWEPAGRQLLLFEDAGRFAAAEPAHFATALAILQNVVANRQATAAPLVVLLRGAGRVATAFARL
jgi:hypothetical protein